MLPSKNNKIKILFCSDSLSSYSGLAYVSANIMLNFMMAENIITSDKKYEVAYATFCGNNSNKVNFKIHNEKFIDCAEDIKVYDCQAIHEKGFSLYNDCVKEFKPDIVFSNLDPWYLDQIAFSSHRDSYYWVCYSTIEVPYYPDNVMFPTSTIPNPRKSIKEILSKADLIIPVTSVGTGAFKDMGLTNIAEKHVYNGLDFSLRCTDENLTKSEIFGTKFKDDDFVFMTLGTNSERKKIDVVIEAFAKFMDKMNWNKKYKLYIHTDVDDQIGGTDLITQIISLGLKDYVFAPLSFRERMIMKREDVYKRYKVCDCYIGLPAGEGFGLANCEAMMHEKPIIYLDYGGPSDYMKGIGLPVKVKDTFAARNIYMKWAIADKDDAVKQMCRIASDEKLRIEMGEKSFKKSQEFSWELIFNDFESVIQKNFGKFQKPVLFDFNLQKIV